MAAGEVPATTSSAAQDSDLDPAAFLKSVRELSEKRDREDVERFRQLEEKVQKEREERAARRAGVSYLHISSASQYSSIGRSCCLLLFTLGSGGLFLPRCWEHSPTSTTTTFSTFAQGP